MKMIVISFVFKREPESADVSIISEAMFRHFTQLDISTGIDSFCNCVIMCKVHIRDFYNDLRTNVDFIKEVESKLGEKLKRTDVD